MTPSTHPLRILVVDDMHEIRRVLGHFLTQALNAEIVEAESGLVGIERFLERTPDLVFCDLTMPEMTGFEFLGFITRQSTDSRFPIVVLTSEDDEQTKVQAAGLSVDAYLLKPFNPSSVLSALQGLVPERSFHAPVRQVA